MAGADVDWRGFYADERRRRVVLPTYPFERKRYWPESGAVRRAARRTSRRSSRKRDARQPPIRSARPARRLVAGRHEPAVPRSGTAARRRRVPCCRNFRATTSSGVDPSTDLLELGLDSLLLTQAATLFQRKFGVSLTFRQLMEELSSLDAIAVASRCPVAAGGGRASRRRQPSQPFDGGACRRRRSRARSLEQLLQQQQQLTNQLLELMGKPQTVAGLPAAAAAAGSGAAAPASGRAPKPDGKSHGPFKPMDRGAGDVRSRPRRAARSTR